MFLLTKQKIYDKNPKTDKRLVTGKLNLDNISYTSIGVFVLLSY